MTDLAPLPRAFLSVLTNLHEAGGSGTLDVNCRVVVGPQRHPLPGDTHTWLTLVSRGLITGERGLIITTEEGRLEAVKVQAGRVREAS